MQIKIEYLLTKISLVPKGAGHFYINGEVTAPFRLSVQNLFTKKRRTTMTAIAGSIGIIGVSLVLSISIGLQDFTWYPNDTIFNEGNLNSMTLFTYNPYADSAAAKWKDNGLSLKIIGI